MFLNTNGELSLNFGPSWIKVIKSSPKNKLYCEKCKVTTDIPHPWEMGAAEEVCVRFVNMHQLHNIEKDNSNV